MTQLVSDSERHFLLTQFLGLNLRFGVTAISPMSELDDTRPGLYVDAQDSDYTRVTYRDGTHAHHVFVPLLYTGQAAAAFLEEAVDHFPFLVHDWEDAPEPMTATPYRVRITKDDGEVYELPYVVATSPLVAWNMALRTRFGQETQVSAPIYPLPIGGTPITLPFWRRALVYRTTGTIYSNAPWLFEAEPVPREDEG